MEGSHSRLKRKRNAVDHIDIDGYSWIAADQMDSKSNNDSLWMSL